MQQDVSASLGPQSAHAHTYGREAIPLYSLPAVLQSVGESYSAHAHAYWGKAFHVSTLPQGIFSVQLAQSPYKNSHWGEAISMPMLYKVFCR